MKKTLFLFSSAFLCLYANAQEQDTIKTKMQAAIADKFALTRAFDVRYIQYMPSDFDSELQDNDFIEGRIKNRSKFNAIANIAVISKPKWNITLSGNYKYEMFELDQVSNIGGVEDFNYNKRYDFHYLSAAISFTGFTTLFKKPFIYNASFITDGNERNAERIKGFVGGSIVLKATAKTKMSLGVIVLIDPASPVPAAPVFTLDHKFNSGWMLDIILPQRVFIKHNVFTNGRVSIGSELVTDGFYFQSATFGFAKTYDFRQLEIRSGLTYEHYINRIMIATFKAGLSNVFNSRVTERGESTNDYVLSTQQEGTGYFSLGFSINPFSKRK